MTKDTKIKCIKNLPPFIEGNEYHSDSRTLINKDNTNDKQVMIIESKNDDDTDNVYIVSLDKVFKHFIVKEKK
jgi:hypothetical protein